MEFANFERKFEVTSNLCLKPIIRDVVEKNIHSDIGTDYSERK